MNHLIKVNADGSVEYPYSIPLLRRENPNASFPKSLSAEVLASFGVFEVTVAPPPAVNSYVSNVISDTPVQAADGTWSVGWVVSEKSADELAVSTQQADEECRTLRGHLLAESDWTQLPDASVDSTAWAQYRQLLRDLPEQAGYPLNVIWPVKPEV